MRKSTYTENHTKMQKTAHRIQQAFLDDEDAWVTVQVWADDYANHVMRWIIINEEYQLFGHVLDAVNDTFNHFHALIRVHLTVLSSDESTEYTMGDPLPRKL